MNQYHHEEGPNVSPGFNVLNDVSFQSAVRVYTVLPHHDCIVLDPILLFPGNCNVKKMTITAIATPESSAAERI